MHIAIMNYSSSGLFHYAASLVNALVNLPGISHITFFTSNHNDLSLIRQHPAITVMPAPIRHTPWSVLMWSLHPSFHRHVRRHLKLHRPDIIHITDTMPMYLLLWDILARHTTVYTQHDPQAHSGDRFSLATRLIQQYLRRLAATVIVHGAGLRNDLIKRAGTKSQLITVIPMGNFSILLECRHGGHPVIPRSVLFFGRIVAYKGLDVLCRALLVLQREGYTTHFFVVGPGDLTPYRPLLRKLQNVTVVNTYVPDNDVHIYFQQSSIVVIPYKEATQSAVVATALPAGRPVIATRVGAIPDVIEDGVNGLLVTPGDIPALAQAVQRLLIDSELRDRLSQGARATSKAYSWNTVAARHLSTYRSLL